MNTFSQDRAKVSFIEFELFQETPYIAGSPLYGNLHFNIAEKLLSVSHIAFTLRGYEYIKIQAGNNKKLNKEIMILEPQNTTKTYEKYHTIVDFSFTITDFKDSFCTVPVGQHTYPFTLYLPEWLP